MQLILEIFRSEQAGDPYAFRFGEQEYVLRSEGGGAETATLSWNEALLQDLEAVRLPGRDPEVTQRVGVRLRRFLNSTRFIEHESDIAAASERGEPVHITLRLSAAELYALPWELLTLRASGQHLGELPGVLLRYVWPETSTAAQTPSPPPEGGRILFAWSAATGAVPAAEHQAALVRACAAGHQGFDAASDVLPNLSMARLAERLAAAAREQRPISILHILCHGARSGSGFGLGWDPDEEPGGSAFVDAGRLRQLLAQHAGTLRTVVLCACDSANSGQLGSHLGSVAQALHRAGIQAVIASRFPLSVAGSVHFTESFYGQLLGLPASLEQAFLAARGRLRQESRSLDWASLQLYARPEDGDDTRPIVLRPYRGLEAFQADHARFLFGRDRERLQTLDSLEALRRAGRPRLLVVAGASGTGKSSVILAGVIPVLARGADAHDDPQPLRQALHHLTEVLGARARRQPLAQALETLSSEVAASSGGAVGGWEWAVMRPGEAPLKALQSALSQRQDAGRPMLIVVDQFEEIFTLTPDPAVRQEFARRLWSLSAKDDGISCIITLRVDFLGHCGELILDDSGLRLDRIAYQEAHRIFVAQMEPEQLHDAIALPARAAGLTLSEGLAEQMIAEVAGEPGALPLLEYVLDLLWQRRQGRELTARSYKELGGVSGALEGNANRVFDALDAAQQSLARRLFLRLTSATTESASAPADALMTSRRRTSLAELREHVSGSDKSAQEQFEQVLAAFVDARLLVRTEEGGRTMVEVAHESLLRRWERLRQWLGEDRQRLGELQELERWGAQWRTYGTLLTGSQLGYATQVMRKYPRDLGPALTRMVLASRRATQQRRIRLTAIVTVALAVLSALTIYARISKQHADRQSAIARSRALGMHAERELNRHSDLALLLAARSLQLYDEPDSHAALATALDKTRYLRTSLRGPKGRINSVAFSADGKLLAGAGADSELWLYDVSRGTVARRLRRPGSGELNAVSFSADGRLLAAGSADGLVPIWDLESPQLEPQTLRGAPLGVQVQGVFSLDFSPDSKILAAGVDDGRVLLWDLATREPRPVPMPGHKQPVASVSFDRSSGRGRGPGAPLLASSSIDGTALVWNAQTGERVLPPLSGYEEYLSSVVFSPSGQLLAAGSVDHSILLWDACAAKPVGSSQGWRGWGKGGQRKNSPLFPDAMG